MSPRLSIWDVLTSPSPPRAKTEQEALAEKVAGWTSLRRRPILVRDVLAVIKEIECADYVLVKASDLSLILYEGPTLPEEKRQEVHAVKHKLKFALLVATRGRF